MNRTKKQHPHAKGKKPIKSGGRPLDISNDYDASCPLYSEDEGKRFCSLVKRKFSMPKYFDDELLVDIEMKEFIDKLCERMGWLRLSSSKYEEVFVNLHQAIT